jgi:hypothetical protein
MTVEVDRGTMFSFANPGKPMRRREAQKWVKYFQAMLNEEDMLMPDALTWKDLGLPKPGTMRSGDLGLPDPSRHA